MRKLDARSLEILRKLAPEISEPVHYRSILPPVSMHHAADEEDFQVRRQSASASYISLPLDMRSEIFCLNLSS
jgi:hypothetical protein